jgi:terminase, large subunit
MSTPFVDPARVVAEACRIGWTPPPRRSLSQWADEKFYLSEGTAASAGRWRCYSYQVGFMDAITNPLVRQVTMKKSARIGYTKMINAAVGYYIDQDPCPIMVVQPRKEDAEGYSLEEIGPMIRDIPCLYEKLPDGADTASTRVRRGKSRNTILHKNFPGGTLSIVGSNSPASFRRVSRKIVIFDEVDAYPVSAGVEGDPIELGMKRSEYYHDRKTIAGSTPLISGTSRIDTLFEEGDQRRFHVPCPHCGHFDFLVFSAREDRRGHVMRWPDNKPELAHFVCSACQGEILPKHKRQIMDRGEWRADKPFNGHASFHIWAAYSLSPNTTWASLAAGFLKAKRTSVEQLKTFINTLLGETWSERGEAPDWERLFNRREEYEIGTVPDGVIILTAGVDVQKDRLVYEVVGWGADKESWSIISGEFYGETSEPAVWDQLKGLLDDSWQDSEGKEHSIRIMAVDSGFRTQTVYNWCRQFPGNRVIAVKGVQKASTLLGTPTLTDLRHNGQRIRHGARVWMVGTSIAKTELYGWLQQKPPEEGNPFPPGWCHIPGYDEEHFKQLTAEKLVERVNKRTKMKTYEWVVLENRQNHKLDCRIYARAAATLCGLDRLKRRPNRENRARSRSAEGVAPPPAPSEPTPVVAQPTPKPGRMRKNRPGSWLSGGGGWLR